MDKKLLKFEKALELAKISNTNIELKPDELKWLIRQIKETRERCNEYVATIDTLATELSQLRGDYQ